MAAITMIFLVFIASVHGDSTCPCKCSFSNIETLSKYIDERIIATINETIATVMNTTISAINSKSAMWTPVDKTNISQGGISLEDATTYSFQIPDVIPLTAREFMVYAIVKCGTAQLQREGDIIFYVMHNGFKFEKFLYMHSYNQAAWNTNSDNIWFPMPADRLIHVEITVALPGDCLALFSAIGYR
jgi:hypothetical protein